MVSTKQFTFSGKDKTFITEISTIGDKQLVRIYPDACDEGVVLVSERTGEESKWVVNGVDQHDGDIGAWNLIPTAETLRKLPQLKGYKMVIFND